jgi:hypothetical protein
LAPATTDEDREFVESVPATSVEPNGDGSAVSYETTELDPVDLPETEAKEDAAAPLRPYETVRLDPAMVEAEMAEVNRRFEQIEQPPPLEKSYVGEDTIRMETRFDTQGSGDLQLEDIDLLDIPAEMEVNMSAPADAAAQGGKQVVTLSPEIIEMIAQRVVEKLAEKH